MSKKDDKRRARAREKRRAGAGKLKHNRPGYNPKAEARAAKAAAVAEANRKRDSRECGPCTACCTVMGIPEIKKRAWVTCEHVCEQGCAIYDKRPSACSGYLCFWRQGYGEDEDRPDQLGVVIGIDTAPALVQVAVGKGVPRRSDDIILMRECVEGAFKSERVRKHVEHILITGGVCAFVHGREGITVFGPAPGPKGIYLPRAAMEAWNKEAAAKRGDMNPRPVFRDDIPEDDLTVVEAPEDFE